jgi:hypothetical protein
VVEGAPTGVEYLSLTGGEYKDAVIDDTLYRITTSDDGNTIFTPTLELLNSLAPGTYTAVLHYTDGFTEPFTITVLPEKPKHPIPITPEPWKPGMDDWSVIITGERDDIEAVLLDDVAMHPDDYTLTDLGDGTVKLTIPGTLISKLAPGNHKIKIIFKNGDADTTLEIIPPDPPIDPPNPPDPPVDPPDPPVDYRVTGPDSWQPGQDDLRIQIDGDPENILEVLLDELPMHPDDYQLETDDNGNTLLIIPAKYLATLNPGAHRIEIRYKNGTGTMNLQINPAIRYRVIQHFGTWTGAGTVTARIDGPLAKHQEVLYNRTVIPHHHYQTSAGSTIIPLTENYLNTLTDGDHILKATYTDGESEPINLTITHTPNKPNPPTKPPVTDPPINNPTLVYPPNKNPPHGTHINTRTPSTTPNTIELLSGLLLLVLAAGTVLFQVNTGLPRRASPSSQ